MSKPPRDRELFARLTKSLLESEAVATLPPTAFKLLTLLALGARRPGLTDRRDKGNNGTQAVTYTYAKRFGFTSKDTLQRGLQVLLERGLIIKTRDGWRTKTHFALYAVAWLPVTHRDGMPLDTPERPSDAWRTWKSSPIVGQDGQKVAANLRPDSRAQTSPIVGQDEAGSCPIVSAREPICAPIVGDTSRLLGYVSEDSSASRSGTMPLSTAAPPVQKLARRKSTKATIEGADTARGAA